MKSGMVCNLPCLNRFAMFHKSLHSLGFSGFPEAPWLPCIQLLVFTFNLSPQRSPYSVDWSGLEVERDFSPGLVRVVIHNAGGLQSRLSYVSECEHIFVSLQFPSGQRPFGGEKKKFILQIMKPSLCFFSWTICCKSVNITGNSSWNPTYTFLFTFCYMSSSVGKLETKLSVHFLLFCVAALAQLKLLLVYPVG